jgi:diguanylate cyclase (GGDEF)-like protein
MSARSRLDRVIARVDRINDDDLRALRRLSSRTWFGVGAMCIALTTIRADLAPGSGARLLIAASFCLLSGTTILVCRPTLVFEAEFTLRVSGMWLLYLNIARDVPSRYWMWCLPLFLVGVLIPSLFGQSVPLAITLINIGAATGLLAIGASGPTGLRAGAWASFSWVTVMIAVTIQRLAVQHRNSLAKLEVLASTDGLTGLANRRHFMTAAADVLSSAHSRRQPCTIVLADIDHFKSVNDTYGHDVGDQVLITVARVLRASCRDGDIVARLGGEEFALVLSGASAIHAQHVTEAAADALRGIRPAAVTVSFGVVEAKIGDSDVSELLTRADTALYQAKQAGRDRTVVALSDAESCTTTIELRVRQPRLAR